MLITYLQATRRLLHDQQFVNFNDYENRDYINQARRQIALDVQLLRPPADLTLTANQQAYALSLAVYASLPDAPQGIGPIVSVRSAALEIQDGYQNITVRSWERFNLFYVNRVARETGQPEIMAQQLLGAGSGTLWFYPIPDAAWVVRLFPVSLPIDLIDDATVEAIPQPWQDTIPYYAAYLAQLGANNKEAAQELWERYETYRDRANMQATGTQLPQTFPVFRAAQKQQEQGR